MLCSDKVSILSRDEVQFGYVFYVFSLCEKPLAQRFLNQLAFATDPILKIKFLTL